MFLWLNHLLYPVQLSLFYVSKRSIKFGISEADIKYLRKLAIDFRGQLPHFKISDNTIVFIHYHDEVSDYLLAYLRAIQIEIKEIYKETFRLRIVETHPSFKGSFKKITDKGAFNAKYYDDPDVEFVTISNNKAVPVPFSKPFSPANHFLTKNQFILGIHEKGVNIQPISYNPEDSLFNTSLHKIIEFGKLADILITGDVPSDLPVPLKSTSPIHQFPMPKVIKLIGDLRNLHFIDGDQKSALYQYLNNHKLSLVFDFSEPDNSDPVLLAHVKGIMAERLEDTGYIFGFYMYLEKVFGLLRKMGFTTEFISEIKHYYTRLNNMRRIRKYISKYGKKYYGITDEQFICMAYRPFINKGGYLHQFLLREHPSLLSKEEEFRKILGEKIIKLSDHDLVKTLETISGLTIEQLQMLYQKNNNQQNPGYLA